jgi:hypothetical protein
LYENYSEYLKTEHNWTNAFEKESLYTIPLFSIFVLQVCLLLTRKYWVKLAFKYLIGKEKLEDEGNQDQISFYESLTLRQRKWLIKDELATREKLGFKKLDDSTLMKLKDV